MCKSSIHAFRKCIIYVYEPLSPYVYIYIELSIFAFIQIDVPTKVAPGHPQSSWV